MSSHNENKCLHIVIYPWFALSHLTSFLRLANKLAERGQNISFFVPTKTQTKLAPHNHHPHLITFVPFDVPHVDGLPVGAETTNDVIGSALPLIMTAMDLTRDMMDSHLACLKPDLVFFEFATWLPELARKHGAKSVHYIGPSLVRSAYVSSRARNLPANHPLTEADLMLAPPGFPCPEMGLQANEARALAGTLGGAFGGRMTFLDRLNIPIEECDAIVAQTCRELEGPYCDFFEKHYGKPVLLAGPVVPDPPASELDAQFDEWLRGFDKGSVVYCALGSECVLDKKQFQELVLGLELTGKPFLAALKPPMECETIESALPEGFSERTKGRGIIHGGWVQQPLILQHVSVGCFVTHCGLESLSEAMVSECGLVMLPQAVDQFINAKRMSMDLKVGVEIEKTEKYDSFFTKEAVSKAIRMVMEVEGQVGKEVKANHAKVREVLLTKGLEDSYINGFIRSLQCLCR